MKYGILAIFAAILAAGFTTQAEATPVPGITETIQAEAENMELAVYGRGHVHKQPKAPDSVTITESGAVLVTFTASLFRPPLAFDLLLNGKPYAAIPGSGSGWGINYTIEVELGLSGIATIEVNDTPQLWWWGSYFGERPMPGDPRLFQTVGPDAFGPDLYGCNVLLKQCYFEGVEEHCPLVCVEPGWTPPTTE